MKPTEFLIGLMTGTSCDGIDVAIVDAKSHALRGFQSHPLSANLQESLLRLAEPSMDDIDHLGHLDQALGDALAKAVEATLCHYGLANSAILLIGSHGQTIRHRPQRMDGGLPFTLQIGCPARIAEYTGITVVSDFRRRDMAAGGQGAPLTPWLHRQLFASPDAHIAVLNIGGIANITWLGKDGGISGFDTGPGNMLMDGLMLHLSDGRYAYDQGGELAAIGQPCHALLAHCLEHPYFAAYPPKSTGREDFGASMLESLLRWPDLDDGSRMMTAAMLTVRSVVDSIRFLPASPEQWLVCGGGVHNHTLMRMLQQQLSPATVSPTDQHGYPADAIEAISFALLADQTVRGQVNTHPAVTGARHATCAGQITPGKNWLQLMQNLDK
ncbi:MAG: anhydro-N-acetylmuramic acid kinase [Mariprofundaceae bacterium]|nr:anhydro-N-acetylmuramic acid kinase [Mariprofundaceae bacterium]